MSFRVCSSIALEVGCLAVAICGTVLTPIGVTARIAMMATGYGINAISLIGLSIYFCKYQGEKPRLQTQSGPTTAQSVAQKALPAPVAAPLTTSPPSPTPAALPPVSSPATPPPAAAAPVESPIFASPVSPTAQPLIASPATPPPAAAPVESPIFASPASPTAQPPIAYPATPSPAVAASVESPIVASPAPPTDPSPAVSPFSTEPAGAPASPLLQFTQVRGPLSIHDNVDATKIHVHFSSLDFSHFYAIVSRDCTIGQLKQIFASLINNEGYSCHVTIKGRKDPDDERILSDLIPSDDTTITAHFSTY